MVLYQKNEAFFFLNTTTQDQRRPAGFVSYASNLCVKSARGSIMLVFKNMCAKGRVDSVRVQ